MYSAVCIVFEVFRGCDSILLQHHGEPLQASGVKVKALGHQVFVENAEGVVVLSNGLDWSKPLQVDHLSPAQQKADPLLQPAGLLLQAAIAGQLLEQLDMAEGRSQHEGKHRVPATARAPLLRYLGPLMMNIHGAQHDLSRSIHP